jgi:hypothetical protein
MRVRGLKHIAVVCSIACGACAARHGNPPPDLARGDLSFVDDLATNAMVQMRSSSTGVLLGGTIILLNRPPMIETGDLMVAHITLGLANNKMPPAVMAPSGWTLLDRLDRTMNDGMLALYWHVADAQSEPAQYSWMASENLAGCGWIGAFTGASTTNPFNVKQGFIDNTSTNKYMTGSVTTKAPNALVLVTFAGHDVTTGPTIWSVPPGVMQLVNFNNNQARSLFTGMVRQDQPGVVGPFSSTTSSTEAYALMYLLALTP